MPTLAPAALRPRRGWSIVFEGDSQTNRRTPPSLDTWPYLELMNWRRTWADEFSRLVFCWRPELRLKLHNAAVGGSNVNGLLERIERMVEPHEPDLLLVTIGNNDPFQNVPLDEFTDKLRGYVRRLARRGCRVGFLGNYPGEAKVQRKKPYQAAIRRIAVAEGCGFLDVGRPLVATLREIQRQWDGHTIYSDGTHLNAVGATVVAGAVLGWLGLGPR
jgi:lysophospholipase L1-like esterase